MELIFLAMFIIHVSALDCHFDGMITEEYELDVPVGEAYKLQVRIDPQCAPFVVLPIRLTVDTGSHPHYRVGTYYTPTPTITIQKDMFPPGFAIPSTHDLRFDDSSEFVGGVTPVNLYYTEDPAFPTITFSIFEGVAALVLTCLCSVLATSVCCVVCPIIVLCALVFNLFISAASHPHLDAHLDSKLPQLDIHPTLARRGSLISQRAPYSPAPGTTAPDISPHVPQHRPDMPYNPPVFYPADNPAQTMLYERRPAPTYPGVAEAEEDVEGE